MAIYRKIDVDAKLSNLDLFSRLYLGQYDEISWLFGFPICYLGTGENPEATMVAKRIRDIFIPQISNCDLNGSLGIWSSDTPEVAVKAYDIQQALRYQLDVHRKLAHPRSPFFHAAWEWNLEDRRSWVGAAHRVLKEQNVPGYSGWIACPWLCPIVIEHFAEDESGADVSVADSEVVEIIEKSNRVYHLVESGEFTELFASLYPDIDVASFRDATDEFAYQMTKGRSDVAPRFRR